jgi:hypothetical protein
MTIQLTNEQWASVRTGETPVRVSDPAHNETFVLLRSDIYERFKSLFEEDPVSEKERLFQLQQFGRRAGWDDPEMDVYDDLDPRRVIRAAVRGRRSRRE